MPNMITIKVGGEAQPVSGDLWPHAQKKKLVIYTQLKIINILDIFQS